MSNPIVNCGENTNCKCRSPKPLVFRSTNKMNYVPREETLNGVNYLVVPLVMMVEGVHVGSGGPIFYSADVLSENAESWNSRPVPLYHPQEGDQFISASASPQIHAEWNVGTVFNARFEDGALRAEAWINIELLRQKDNSVLTRLQNGEAMDVSIGVMSDIQSSSGVWNNESYSMVAYNLRPDHVALLPDQRGACSWDDGCGVRVNQAVTKERVMNKSEFLEYAIKHGLIANNLSDGYMQIRSGLQDCLDKMDVYSDNMGEYKVHYVLDFDDQSVVYRLSRSGTSKVYQAPYSEKDGVYSVQMNDSVEVVPVTKTSYKELNVNAEGQEDTMKKEVTVNQEITKEQALQALKASGPLSHEEIVGLMNDQQKQLTNNMAAFYNAAKAELTGWLKDNAGLSEAILANCSIEDLAASKASIEAKLKVNESVVTPATVDYSGMAAGTPVVNSNTNTILLPLAVKAAQSK